VLYVCPFDESGRVPFGDWCEAIAAGYMVFFGEQKEGGGGNCGRVCVCFYMGRSLNSGTRFSGFGTRGCSRGVRVSVFLFSSALPPPHRSLDLLSSGGGFRITLTDGSE
jgi:hypothetical protein